MAAQLRLLTITLLLCFAAPGIADAETRPSYGSVLKGAVLEEPWEVDPLRVQSHTDVTLCRLIFDTLYRVRNGKIEPHLASSLPDASDPKRVRIEIRPGVLFHNGQSLSVTDVAKSLERLRRSKSLAWYFSNVVAVEADNTSVVIQLSEPDERLAERLSVIHTAITLGGRRPRWQRLIGTGPYLLKQRSASKRRLVLSSFEKYFAGRSYLDELNLRWHENGQAEARDYERGLTQLSNRGEVAFAGHRPKYRTEKHEAAPTTLSFVGFGSAHPSINSSVEFRRALSLAIGRSSMRQIGTGETVLPTLSPIPVSDGPEGQAQKLGPQTNEARKLIMNVARTEPALAAGELTLEILVNKSRPDDRVVAGKVAAALFSLGIGSRIVVSSAPAFHRRVHDGQSDLYIGQLAHTFMSAKEQLIRQFVLGSAAANVALKLELSVAIERFGDTLPIIPLFHKGLLVHHREDVHGMGFGPSTGLAFENLFFFGSPDKN